MVKRPLFWPERELSQLAARRLIHTLRIEDNPRSVQIRIPPLFLFFIRENLYSSVAKIIYETSRFKIITLFCLVPLTFINRIQAESKQKRPILHYCSQLSKNH